MSAHIWATTRKVLQFTLCSLVILFGLASIMATGGGGGGTGASGGGGGTSGGTGLVAVSLGDGPADDYDHIWVYVTKVSLIPAPGNNAGDVVIYQSPTPAGHKVDLLAYREEDFFLGIKNDVPAGRYEKIRLEVADIVAEGSHQLCTQLEIKLPSGKIDLNPQGGFEVRPGETLAIRLDMDANKSINLHPAGKSGKCIFRPVVFVDIKPGTVFQRCPMNLTGTITELLDRDQNGTTDGFVLNLAHAHGLLPVWLETDAPVFDAIGLPATPKDLATGQQVWTRGRLDAQGRFRARVAVIGQVLAIDGVAQGAVDAPSETFPFLPDAGQEIVGETKVKLSKDQSLVFRGCDTEVAWDAIAADVAGRVFGKFWVPSSELRAAVVLLRHVEIAGVVENFADSSTPAGRSLDIRTSPTDVKTVFVPTGTPIFLEGDGLVPLTMVCTGTRVRVRLDPNVSQPTAADVKVLADLLEGTVSDAWTSGANPLLVLPAGQPEQAVHVRDTATIIDVRDNNYKLLKLGDLKVGEQVKVFGLKPSPCNSNEDEFEAFVILVVGP